MGEWFARIRLGGRFDRCGLVSVHTEQLERRGGAGAVAVLKGQKRGLRAAWLARSTVRGGEGRCATAMAMGRCSALKRRRRLGDGRGSKGGAPRASRRSSSFHAGQLLTARAAKKSGGASRWRKGRRWCGSAKCR